MKTKLKARFIKSVIETARQNDTELPWSRGPRRAALIAQRQAEQLPRVRTA